MEESARNIKNEDEEMNAEAKLSVAKTDRYVPDYKTMIMNMEGLRINLENHLRNNENIIDNTDEFASYARNAVDNNLTIKEKVQIKNTKPTIIDQNSDNEKTYVLSFKKLIANTKILVDDEINEFEETQSKNAFNTKGMFFNESFNLNENHAGPSYFFNDTELNIQSLFGWKNFEVNVEEIETDDMKERTKNNILEQLGQMGYGFIDLNDEVECLTELDQGAVKKFLKNFYNSLIKNNVTAKDEDSTDY